MMSIYFIRTYLSHHIFLYIEFIIIIILFIFFFSFYFDNLC